MVPPTWAAVIVHVPYDTIVTSPVLVTVHTNGVDDVYDTARPESAVALSEKTAASSSTGAGAAKVIVWPVRTVND